jgi:hypothetical protein
MNALGRAPQAELCDRIQQRTDYATSSAVEKREDDLRWPVLAGMNVGGVSEAATRHGGKIDDS